MKIYPPLVIKAYEFTDGWSNWGYGWFVLGMKRPCKWLGKNFKYNNITYHIDLWSDNIITISREEKIIFRFLKFIIQK